MHKRINVKIEHVQHSKCRDDFLNRVKKNEATKAAVKAAKGKGKGETGSGGGGQGRGGGNGKGKKSWS